VLIKRLSDDLMNGPVIALANDGCPNGKMRGARKRSKEKRGGRMERNGAKRGATIWGSTLLMLVLVGSVLAGEGERTGRVDRPNIVLILLDDAGYGDLSSYGAKAIETPQLDRLGREGMRLTDGHAAAATCTPSRYAILTGEYAFRRTGTGVLPGDAGLVLDPNRLTLPGMLQRAGYVTGVVGKWHLGLGPAGGPDWNGEIRPSANDVGFDEAFLMAATGDRVPTVYVRNRSVVGLDPSDPIEVSYRAAIGTWPTGRSHPEELRLVPSHGHDMTIVNGISRIGWMTGGRSALWKDEQMADLFAQEAISFLERHRERPFFLYFATHDPHVPRTPHPRFVGKTGMGPRGDALVQMDWSVGQILETLDRLGLTQQTLVIATSDNGPVVDDGYRDEAVEKLGTHRPAGPWRGGKYSNFEAGTRVPFLVRWPGQVRVGVSSALLSQVDLFASLASLVGQPLEKGVAPDSQPLLDALLGRSLRGRQQLVLQAGSLSLREGEWKYIEPGVGRPRSEETGIELGNDRSPQLYHLGRDPGETVNLARQQFARTSRMAGELRRIREGAPPTGRKPAVRVAPPPSNRPPSIRTPLNRLENPR
jgi:arylsulfatase A-like enzyme